METNESQRGHLADRGSRRAKGLNLAPLVKLLKSWRRQQGVEAIPGIPSAHRALLEGERILSGSWYPMGAFIAALDAVHLLLLGQSEAGCIRLGRGGAEHAYAAAHAAYIKSTPADRMRIFSRIWRANFDFGSIDAEVRARH